jgi:hypothetical protein
MLAYPELIASTPLSAPKGTPFMPTQTKSDPITESVQEAAERAADLHEKAVASSKKASEAYVSSYVKAVVTLADTYEKATGASNIEWVASIGSLQADATREFAHAYASSVREFVS